MVTETIYYFMKVVTPMLTPVTQAIASQYISLSMDTILIKVERN